MTEPPSPTIEGDFATDGAACVRGLLTPSEVDDAAAAIEAVLADPSPSAKRASADDDGAFVEDFCRWGDVPAIEALARRSAAPGVAARLTGSDRVRLYHDHVLVKEPGTRQRTPWHQDLPYYNVDGHRLVSLWIPVDAVDAASALQVVAGSHRGPWYTPRTFLDDEARWFPEGTLAELPDIDDDPDVEVLTWELEPGDAIAFHMLSLHAAPGVPGPARRRVLSLRYLGDDAVHAPRRWTTSPPFPGLEDELAAGGPMDHPLFPVVWDGGAIAEDAPIP